MTRKACVSVTVFTIAVTMAAVYLFGLHQGLTGEGLSIPQEAFVYRTRLPGHKLVLSSLQKML
jgi:hypothetical protein